MSVPRMRTAPEAIAEIKKADPNTSLTIRALRRMLNNGEIPFITVNSKRLINLDNLFEYLNNPSENASESLSDHLKITRIIE